MWRSSRTAFPWKHQEKKPGWSLYAQRFVLGLPGGNQKTDLMVYRQGNGTSETQKGIKGLHPISFEYVNLSFP